MKKLMFGIAGVISIMIPALADVNSDTAKLKAACQASDKTLWVERNQVCIPRNPCKDSKFEQYCNRDFAEYQSPKGSNMYIHLINLYADTHNLTCFAVPQDAKWVGQDFVVCQGTDIMVFEFADIEDHNIYRDIRHESVWHQATFDALCHAIGGYSDKDRTALKRECSIRSKCPDNLDKALIDYDSSYLFVDNQSEYCTIHIDLEKLAEYEFESDKKSMAGF